MPKRIFKYPLEITDKQVLKLPRDHRILNVIEQNGQLVVYAIVEYSHYSTDVTIYIRGTGHFMEDAECADYITTVKVHQHVWHVFCKGGHLQ